VQVPWELLGLVRSPPVHLHTLLFAWQSGPGALIAAALDAFLVVWYVAALRRLSARGRRWPRTRTLPFMVGVAAIVVAVNSGLAYYDDSVFTLHIVQHYLLMDFAPPMLAFGAPMTLTLQALSRRHQSRLARVLHSRVVRAVTHPMVTVPLYYLTMPVYLLTVLYPLSEAHPVFHDFTHLWFLVSGCLFWWRIVGLDPLQPRLGYGTRLLMLVPGIPVVSFVGISIMSMSKPIAPEHTLTDTHTGGELFWILGGLLMLIGLISLIYHWMRDEELKGERLDRQLDRRLEAPGPVAIGSQAAYASEQFELDEEGLITPWWVARSGREGNRRSVWAGGQSPLGLGGRAIARRRGASL